MKQTIEWFREREAQIVICILPNGEKRELLVTDPKHYFSMQDRRYLFEAKLRIHRKPLEDCESCSG